MPYQANSINEMQRDAVAQSLQNNPYFQPHTVPALDNSLKTVSKKIVGAINELVVGSKKNWDSLGNYSQQTDTKLVDLDTRITGMDTKTTRMDTDVATIKQDVVAINQNVTDTYEAIASHIENHPTGTGGEVQMRKIFETVFAKSNLRTTVALPSEVDINKMKIKVFQLESGSTTLYKERTKLYTSGSTGANYFYDPYKLVYNAAEQKYYIGPDFYADSQTLIQIYQ